MDSRSLLRSRPRAKGIAAFAAAGLALTLAACGTSTPAAPASSSDSPTTAASSSAATEAPSLAGKKIGYVDLIGAGAMQQRFYSYFTAGAKALGWEVIFQDGKGDPTLANTAAVNLLNQGIDALVVSCADTAPMRPALKLAKEKGIPALEAGCPMSDNSLWDGVYALDDAAVGAKLGEYVASQIGQGAKAGILGDTTIIAGKVRTDALLAAMTSAKIDVVGTQSINLADLVNDSRKSTASFLTANPDLAAVFAVYDFFAAPAGDAIKAAGKTGTAAVYSFFADAVNAPYMKTANSPLKAVADGPVEQVGLLAIDQLVGFWAAKIPFDSATAQALVVPLTIYTKDNLPETPEGYLTPYPVDPYLAAVVEKWTTTYGLKLS